MSIYDFELNFPAVGDDGDSQTKKNIYFLDVFTAS